MACTQKITHLELASFKVIIGGVVYEASPKLYIVSKTVRQHGIAARPFPTASKNGPGYMRLTHRILYL